MIYARNRDAESGPGYYVVSPLCAKSARVRGGIIRVKRLLFIDGLLGLPGPIIHSSVPPQPHVFLWTSCGRTCEPTPTHYTPLTK